MSLALQIVLCLAVVTITVFLVLLLVQARRTAAAAERLADSAAQDLRQVTEDIHGMRLQVEETAEMIRGIAGLPSTLTQVVAGVARALPAWLHSGRSGGSWIETLLSGIQTALRLFHRPKANHSKEGTHE